MRVGVDAVWASGCMAQMHIPAHVRKLRLLRHGLIGDSVGATACACVTAGRRARRPGRLRPTEGLGHIRRQALIPLVATLRSGVCERGVRGERAAH